MSEPIIRIENLGKAYRLGQAGVRHAMFRDMVLDLVKAPIRRLKQLGQPAKGDDLFWALRDVSFDVERGEIVGIIGRNGAGKSTLLKILSRITEPTEGQVTLSGRVASLLEVGTGFHPELTGRENIYLNGTILGMTKAEIGRKFSEIVTFAEIEKFLDTPVKHYSSGMYVRLAFAVAAHLEPEILIVDEVLAVGDAAFQAKCLGKMKEVSREGGRTILFVSHNLAAVRSLCSRCIVLQGGLVSFDGDAENGAHHYMRESFLGGSVASVAFDEINRDEPQMTVARLSSAGESVSTISMGDELTLEVEYRCPHEITTPKLGFVISTDEGYRVINANNRYQRSNDMPVPSTRGRIRCELGVVPFMAGDYTLSLWFGDGVRDTHTVENALRFRVVEKDIWGTGRVPPTHASLMWWSTEFHVEQI